MLDHTGAKMARSILVVDDEESLTATLAAVLSAGGHHVDTAPDGLIALEKLAQHPYDLIISDIGMPGLDGPGLYRALERHHPTLVGRIVFITGDARRRETRRFIELTKAPILCKPFDIAQLLALVRDILERNPSPGRP